MSSAPDLQRAFMRYNAALMTLTAHAASELDLTPSEMIACEHLHLDGPLTPSQLGRRVMLTSGAVTSLIDRLVARGVAEREPNPSDRRSVLVHYRPPDRAMVGRQLAVMRKVGVLVQSLDEDSREAIAAFLLAAGEVLLEVAQPPEEGVDHTPPTTPGQG